MTGDTGTGEGANGGRLLVAGIGNIFFGDDGFGTEVVRRLDPASVPAGVDVVDYGIRGVHLAYDLLDGRHDTLLMVDALPMGEPPGTLAVLEVDPGEVPDDVRVEAHSMSPAAVLQALAGLGGSVNRVLILGCQPAVVDERMELSTTVRTALGDAQRLLTEQMANEAARLRAEVVTPT